MVGLLRYFFVTIYLAGAINHTHTHQSNDHIANSLMNISRYMSKPYMWVRANLARIYSPYHPGRYGQYSTTIAEIIYRNFLAETLLTVAPFALAIGEMAVFPRYLSYNLRGDSFHHIVGDIESSEFNKSFSLLNLNICFLPGELPLFFGGVAASSERLDDIASLIKEKDPDVVCLYEVHEIDSAYELLNRLKGEYAHFYIDIGPNFLEMNSGLFVASKFEVKDPEFKPFQYLEMQDQINKGYFEFKVVDGEKIISKIYTTHLQPYRKKVDEKIRKKEIEEIIQDIQLEMEENQKYPVIVCGDLNIPWNSMEYVDSQLKEFFYDAYTEGIVTVDASNLTYSAFLGDDRWDTTNLDLQFDHKKSHYSEIVDYALLFNTSNNVTINTVRLDSFDVDNPSEALSDHHGLYSIIDISDVL